MMVAVRLVLYSIASSPKKPPTPMLATLTSAPSSLVTLTSKVPVFSAHSKRDPTTDDVYFFAKGPRAESGAQNCSNFYGVLGADGRPTWFATASHDTAYYTHSGPLHLSRFDAAWVARNYAVAPALRPARASSPRSRSTTSAARCARSRRRARSSPTPRARAAASGASISSPRTYRASSSMAKSSTRACRRATSSSGPTTLNLTKSAYDAFPVTLHYIYALGDGKLAANKDNNSKS